MRACNNLPQPLPYIFGFGGLWKIVVCSQSSSQCLLVSTVFGMVSSLHPTSFLMIFTLVYLCAVNKFYVGIYLCNNIGPVLVCLLSGSTDVTTSPSRYMTQPSGNPILSPVLFMHVGDPYIPLFKIRRIFDLLVSPPFLLFIQRGSNPSIDVYAHIFIILTHYPIPFSTLILL